MKKQDSGKDLKLIEEQVKRFSSKLEKQMTEIRDDLEKKIFNSAHNMVQANSELTRSVETGLIKFEDKCVTIIQVVEKISETN